MSETSQQHNGALPEQRILRIGERLNDGTVVLSVDIVANVALFLPSKIFVGRCDFDNQNVLAIIANKDNLHGYSDWRNITDLEGLKLSEQWDTVAQGELKNLGKPLFWLSTLFHEINAHAAGGRVPSGCKTIMRRSDSLPVPVIRSGPATTMDA